MPRAARGTNKQQRAWISEGMHPAFCTLYPGWHPIFDPPDVRAYLMVEQEGPKGHGYNIREESLTGRGYDYIASGPVFGLSHIFYAAGLLSPLREWYPVELYEQWAEKHASRLAELRRDNPLCDHNGARRQAALKRSFEELGPPRDWCLLAALMEPGDVVIPVVESSAAPWATRKNSNLLPPKEAANE